MGKTGENIHESSCFCTGDSRTFFTAKGGLFVFAAFQPADRQARMGVAANVRERALDDIADSHIRKGRSPEKPQIFLYLYHAAAARRAIATKAKPSEDSTAFCIYLILMAATPNLISFAAIENK